MSDDAYGQMLRMIIVRTEVPSLRRLAHEPMNREVLRVTVLFSRSRAANSVTTVIREAGTDRVRVESVFQGLFNHKAIQREMTLEDYTDFVMKLRLYGFDGLPQQSPAPLTANHDIWLVERASASFEKSVVLPNQPHDEAPYDAILSLIKNNLPEVEREISL